MGQVDDAGPGDHVTRSTAVDVRSAILACHLSHGDSGDFSQSGQPSVVWRRDHNDNARPWNHASAWSKRGVVYTVIVAHDDYHDHDDHHDNDVTGPGLVAVG
ncbi:hypothetical protein N806_21475 [Rhodococcus sp. P27]|nr:hypothetical protein N806_21475 [Rhodococcus sp. P27]